MNGNEWSLNTSIVNAKETVAKVTMALGQQSLARGTGRGGRRRNSAPSTALPAAPAAHLIGHDDKSCNDPDPAETILIKIYLQTLVYNVACFKLNYTHLETPKLA